METFPAEFYRFSTKYPQSGIRIQLGRSYQFDTEPEAPDQRLLTLKLQGMQYFVTALGALDLSTLPSRNMGILESFYNNHKTHKTFTLKHPTYGFMECKFNRPLEIPEGIAGGNGLLPEFDVEMIEIP